ncbi:MAG: cytochrome C oxidase subunit IV family protein [Acidimicrobiia bacterium]
MSDQHASTVHHPTPKLYVQLALILAVLTAIEVALFYLEGTIGRGLARTTLVFLAFLKFVAVIGWYMHLRYEKNLLSRLFTTGFILACSLYGIVLASYGLSAIFG